jgi:NitT/TauT family transport system permease protein
MIRHPIKGRTRYIIMVVSIAIIVLGYWWLMHRQKAKNPKDTTIPSLVQFKEGWRIMNEPDLVGNIMLRDNIKATAIRYLWGMGIGIAMAFTIGVFMGCWNEVDSFFSLPVAFFAAIPATAMLSVYMAFFHDIENRLVAIVALGIFPLLAKSISISARKDVTEQRVFKAYTLGAGHFEVVKDVVFLQILPRMLDGVRLSLGPGMVFLIAGEALFVDEGLGYVLRIQARNLNMNVVYIFLVILGITFILADYSLKMLRRWLCPWFGD